jgi:hypothetical protein
MLKEMEQDIENKIIKIEEFKILQQQNLYFKINFELKNNK